VTGNDPLSPLQGTLADLVCWLDEAGVPYAIVGGLAASILGRPRITRDIDVLAILEEDAWGTLVASGKSRGFVPRISDCVQFARESRVLLLRHEATSVEVDLVCAGIAYEEQIVHQASSRDLSTIAVRLPRPEDLIIMKAVAQRPRDVGDIEGIVDVQATLDWDYIVDLAREFAEVLDSSDILRTVETFRRRSLGEAVNGFEPEY